MSPFTRCCSGLLLALLLALCLSPAPTSAEYDIFTRYSVNRPEGGRHFYLYSPTRYTLSPSPTPLPLALFFHGWTDTCEQWISQFSVFALAAEQYQYHLAVMCGTLTPDGGPGWNSGFFLQRFNDSTLPDDIAYTRAVVATVQQHVHVQPDRTFAMGHSNGAMMSELLACNASDLIHSIAANAGSTILTSDPKASLALCTTAYANNRTSILKVHGTADTAVPYNGTDTQASARVDFLAWGQRNGCQGEPRVQWKRGIATSEGWVGCGAGTDVELVTIAGGVHMWHLNSDFASSLYTLGFFDRVSHRYNQTAQSE